MTHHELLAIEQEIKLDKESMRLCLGIPYRTYQNYCYGVNKIPAEIERKALELLQINKTFKATAPARIDARIKAEFPYGIASEVSE